MVNPAPALPASLANHTGADYFIPNQTEAELLTGRPVHTVEEAAACAALLETGPHRHGCSTVSSEHERVLVHDRGVVKK